VNNVGIDFAGDHFVFCLARFCMTPNTTAFTAYWTNNPYSSRNHSFSHLYSPTYYSSTKRWTASSASASILDVLISCLPFLHTCSRLASFFCFVESGARWPRLYRLGCLDLGLYCQPFSDGEEGDVQNQQAQSMYCLWPVHWDGVFAAGSARDDRSLYEIYIVNMFSLLICSWSALYHT
jgi:hypothetical protein